MPKIPALRLLTLPHPPTIIVSMLVTIAAAANLVYIHSLRTQLTVSQHAIRQLQDQTSSQLTHITELENEDQRQKNTELATTIREIQSSYSKSVSVYEDLSDLKLISKNTPKLDQAYAQAITFLVNRNYASASATLTTLSIDIATEKAKSSTIAATANLPTSNTPPGSGYSRQTVTTDAGSFAISLIAGDLGSTKVIVDTASDGNCSDNCPVLPLATYVSRNGAFAGVNGSYFCPADYSSCAGKTNSFDLLVMNKNKVYFNSDNNVYSTNPAVIFGGGYVRFVSTASEWGRDTGVDGVLSNYPLLLHGGSIRFGGDDDPKKGSRGNRSFVANKGSVVYIGVVHAATVAESARALKALDMENALNLDDGGSTALWSGGYKVGPGRSLPNAILFVRK